MDCLKQRYAIEAEAIQTGAAQAPVTKQHACVPDRELVSSCLLREAALTYAEARRREAQVRVDGYLHVNAIRALLRAQYVSGATKAGAAQSCGWSWQTAKRTFELLNRRGLQHWELIEPLSNKEMEDVLFAVSRGTCVAPDFHAVQWRMFHEGSTLHAEWLRYFRENDDKKRLCFALFRRRHAATFNWRPKAVFSYIDDGGTMAKGVVK